MYLEYKYETKRQLSISHEHMLFSRSGERLLLSLKRTMTLENSFISVFLMNMNYKHFFINDQTMSGNMVKMFNFLFGTVTFSPKPVYLG